ncbi:hypothetical protein C4D60_Mb00t19720 [Musa balbisiana]|uniref:Uncharacterized protein n=1 Tax=Musa balbisiana TaxID=52838 RepID=A0A4S8I532_MUSBA|nr:hypothetical protein C4D60_Mb00t19720 [Musa balbisiana]
MKLSWFSTGGLKDEAGVKAGGVSDKSHEALLFLAHLMGDGHKTEEETPLTSAGSESEITQAQTSLVTPKHHQQVWDAEYTLNSGRAILRRQREGVHRKPSHSNITVRG